MKSPVVFCGIQLENRSARSATDMGMCEAKTGVPEQKFYEFYTSLAKGHPGLVIMEHSFVAMRGHSGLLQLGIHTDDMIQYHKKVIDLMRQANPSVKLCCQLAHAGPIAGEANKIDINTAKKEEFEEAVKQFGEAAIRAQTAGYDCVQIHSAHQYLLSSTISDYFNKRTDEYAPGNFKLLKDVLAEIKQKVKIPVGVKLQSDDFIEGNTMNAQQAAKIVNELQFDFVEISGGGGIQSKYITIRPGKDKYYYKHVVTEFNKLKLMQKQPVIVTGGMDLEIAEDALKDGATLVGFSRKFLRNDGFMVDDGKKCFRCNQCISGLVKHGHAECPHYLKETKAQQVE